MVTWEDKCCKQKYSTSSSFLWPFIDEGDVLQRRIFLWSTWVNCPGYVPAQILVRL